MPSSSNPALSSREDGPPQAPSSDPDPVPQNRSLTIAVIGAGSLGWQLAALSARAGYRTVLEDLMPSNIRRAQTGIVAVLAQTVAPETLDSVTRLITYASSVEDAVRTADLALDCVPDELESKLEIFSLLDRMAPPRTILCTPSEALSIADLASCTYRADRCVAVRQATAPKDAAATSIAIPGENLAAAAAIRLIRTPSTSDATIDLVSAFWSACGKAIAWEMDAPAVPL